MNGVNPIPISPTQRVDDPSLMLRVNQRITAEILQVSNDQVALALDGMQVIARMTSSDQAAALEEQRVAQFLVRGFEGGTVTLQLLQQSAQGRAAVEAPPELIPNILQLHQLPQDPETILLAEVLLEQGQTITPNAIQAMKDALHSFQQWGRPHAEAAAALYADGMPLGKESIQLNLEPYQPLHTVTTDLIQVLKEIDPSGLSDSARSALTEAMQALQVIPLDLAEPEGMAERIEQILQLFGRTLEHDLAQTALEGRETVSDNLLLSLGKLQDSLDPMQHKLVQAKLNQFVECLEHNHLANLPHNSGLDELSALEFHIPFSLPSKSGQTDAPHNARLRISRDGNHEDGAPAMPSHVNLRVDLPKGSIDVNLTFNNNQIGTLIATNAEVLQDAVQAEIPRFEEDLTQHGFRVSRTRCVLDSLDEPVKPAHGEWSSLSAINVEA